MLNTVADIWSELKRYISQVDREEAADAVITLLIDADYDASEIKSAFTGDSDIKTALGNHAVEIDTEEEQDEDEEDEEEYYNEDWEE